MVKLGAAGLFALIALLAVARVFLMGSGGGAEEDQTIILDAGPDFGAASAPRPASSPPTEAPALAPAAREDYPSGVPSLTRSAGPAGLVAFPEVGPGFEVEPGVTWQRVRLMPSRQSIGNPPPGSLMTLWLYLPAGHHDAASLPCILIAPAGSTLVTGNGWYEPGAPPSAPSDPPRGDEGRHPEHLPYVRAGFAVLGYELDGAVPENYSEGQFVSGVRRFLAARAGLDNAHVAMEFLKARVPQVDPNRIYAAGHSSAATTALLVAANEPGIAGCVAFAPCVDVMGRFQRATGDAEGVIRDLERGVPGARALFTTYAPAENLARLSCPVFLLHAEDDANVPIADSRLVVERCRPGQVAMVGVSAGGHYDPMIRGGIDRAIQWLKEQGARPVPPGASAGPAPAGGQMEAIPGF
jgi:dienelactone hydrolase